MTVVNRGGPRGIVSPVRPATHTPTSAPSTAPSHPTAATAGVLSGAVSPPRMKATSITSISATFDFGGNGKRLNPGDEIRLELPEHIRTSGIRSVMLSHRQDASFDTGHNATTGRDDRPGLTSLNFRSIKDGTWRDWIAPWGASGPKGAKFAEQRPASNPEFENMFDWNSRGHKNADTDRDTTTELLLSDEARILSVGTDPVFVHKVIVNVMGEKPQQLVEGIFSEGTAFGDWQTASGRKYGGGQSFQGKFPNAIELGRSGGGAGAARLPAGWRVNGNSLEIPLEPHKVITTVDVAAGDSHPDGIRNKDGGWGTPGWARISMSLRHANGTEERFVDNQGVPPEGIISGAPVAVNQVTKPGDSLVISGTNDTLYVMGVRIGLKPGS